MCKTKLLMILSKFSWKCAFIKLKGWFIVGRAIVILTHSHKNTQFIGLSLRIARKISIARPSCDRLQTSLKNVYNTIALWFCQILPESVVLSNFAWKCGFIKFCLKMCVRLYIALLFYQILSENVVLSNFDWKCVQGYVN